MLRLSRPSRHTARSDEMYKNVHKTFDVTIGKPIPWQTFDKSRTPAQWAQYVKDIVYDLQQTHQ